MSEQPVAPEQQVHTVNTMNMLTNYKKRLNDEVEGRLLAETAVDELLAVNNSLREQIAELQRTKDESEAQLKKELDEIREEVNSLRDNL